MKRNPLIGMLLALCFLFFATYGGNWAPIAKLDSLLLNQLSKVIYQDALEAPYIRINNTYLKSELIHINQQSELNYPQAILGRYFYLPVPVEEWKPLFQIHENKVIAQKDLQILNQWTGGDASFHSGGIVQSGFIRQAAGPDGAVWIPTLPLPAPILLRSSQAAPKSSLVIEAPTLKEGKAEIPLIWAISHQAAFISPVWQLPFEWGFACLVLAILMAATNRGSSGSILLVLILAPTILLIANLLMMILHRYWLPVSDLTLAILIGCFVAMVQANKVRAYQFLQKNYVADRESLYRFQLEKQQFDETFSHIESRGFQRELKRVGYELALGLERKRSFDKAAKVYRMLGRHGHFEDSKQRLDRIKKMSGQSTITDKKSTLIMDKDSLQLPELGRYQIIEEIGRGSMGVVYKARDPKIDRELAIKTVSFSELSSEEIESVKQRFFREAQAAGKLNHPNIVTVFDVGEEKDLAYIAMDYVDGQPLSKYTDETKLLPYTQVFQLFIQAAEALQLAHSQAIVHRDIKPSNMLYNRSKHLVKVSDFGIARISDTRQTQTGIVLGSPSYMSPEQIRGEALTGQSDIFSLGVSLYQMLTGHLPFTGETLPALAYAITHHKHRSVREHRPELPVSATRIVNKALQKEPESRFSDAGLMAKALKSALIKDKEETK